MKPLNKCKLGEKVMESLVVQRSRLVPTWRAMVFCFTTPLVYLNVPITSFFLKYSHFSFRFSSVCTWDLVLFVHGIQLPQFNFHLSWLQVYFLFTHDSAPTAQFTIDLVPTVLFTLKPALKLYLYLIRLL